MFLGFLGNLNIRLQKAQYLDTFYKMLTSFDNKDVHYIITEEYLKKYENVWANCLLDYDSFDFNLVNKTIIDTCNYYTDLPVMGQLTSYNVDNSQFLRSQPLGIKENDIHCILTWLNNNTLRSIAQENNIPIIHNELGALRPDLWKDSIYLDFKGVNHNTEFNERLENFLRIADRLPLLTHMELLNLVALDRKSVLDIYHNRDKSDKYGVALQVARDSNLILYNRGWHIRDVVNYAYNKYGKENILIKNHPHSLLQHIGNDVANLEFSNDKNELLRRSKKIVTINSSMAFEALLLGKDAEILGDNTFKTLIDIKKDSNPRLFLKALNFAVVSYLVPSYLLFDKDYYNYRIECKDEKELFNNGLHNWQMSKWKINNSGLINGHLSELVSASILLSSCCLESLI